VDISVAFLLIISCHFNITSFSPYRRNTDSSAIKLNSIDNMRQDGKFIVNGEIPEGQGSITTLLSECFEVAYELRADAEREEAEDDDDEDEERTRQRLEQARLEDEEKEDEVPDMNEDEEEEEIDGGGLARTASRRHDPIAVK